LTRYAATGAEDGIGVPVDWHEVEPWPFARNPDTNVTKLVVMRKYCAGYFVNRPLNEHGGLLAIADWPHHDHQHPSYRIEEHPFATTAQRLPDPPRQTHQVSRARNDQRWIVNDVLQREPVKPLVEGARKREILSPMLFDDKPEWGLLRRQERLGTIMHCVDIYASTNMQAKHAS